MRYVHSWPPPSGRRVRRRPLPVDPHDPAAPCEEPEALMENRPVARDCEVCGWPFRPESPAVADATICTWCAFHEREGL